MSSLHDLHAVLPTARLVPTPTPAAVPTAPAIPPSQPRDRLEVTPRDSSGHGHAPTIRPAPPTVRPAPPSVRPAPPTVRPAPIRSDVWINGESTTSVTPGAALDLALRFTDAAGRQLTRFDLEHEKLLHLIIASADGTSLAHVHPRLSDGTFAIRLNAPNTDPDNQDASSAIAHPGRYFLFAEFKPAGGPTQLVRLRLDAAAEAPPATPQPDVAVAPGVYEKYLDAEGQPTGAGGTLRARLAVRPVTHAGATMLHFDVDLSVKTTAGSYTAAEIEPWLGMSGHALLIGTTGDVDSRFFQHLHVAGHSMAAMPAHQMAAQAMAQAPTSGRLAFMSDQVPPAGAYNLWIQTKYQGRVITVPFTLSNRAAESSPATTPAPAEPTVPSLARAKAVGAFLAPYVDRATAEMQRLAASGVARREAAERAVTGVFGPALPALATGTSRTHGGVLVENGRSWSTPAGQAVFHAYSSRFIGNGTGFEYTQFVVDPRNGDTYVVQLNPNSAGTHTVYGPLTPPENARLIGAVPALEQEAFSLAVNAGLMGR